MALTGVRVAHAIPGRVRLKIQQVQGNRDLAWEVEERLSRLPGVESVEANPVTGSVTVLFRHRQASTGESIRSLCAAWPGTLGSLDADALEATMAIGANGGHEGRGFSAAGMDRQIVGLLGSVNRRVADVSRGADLKVLVPVGLFLLGVRGLFSEKLPFPAWYDFFWFALSTFVMLNGAAIQDASVGSGQEIVAL